jgi:hypothetical protein
MKKILKLTEGKLINHIKKLIKEDEIEEVVISPEEYFSLLQKVFGQAQAIPKLPKFRGKKLVIRGNLDFDKFRNYELLTDLGNIKVDGNINISYTNIKSLDDVEVTGAKRYWSTPYEGVMRKRKQQEKYNEQEVRRENNEWSLDGTDEEGEKANAAFEYAVQEGNLTTLTDEEKERLETLKLSLSELEQQMEDEEDEERYDELTDEFNEVQDEIDDFTNGNEVVDVYDLYPMGTHYDMTAFESLSTGNEYAVGTEDEAESSLSDYFEEHVDNPTQYFDKNFLSYYIDEEEVKDYFRDTVEEWIRDSPEDYDVEKGLSDDQEEEIWLLEMEKWVYENEGVRAPIQYPTKEEGNVFDFEDAEGNRFEYKNEGSGWVLYKDGQVVPPHQIYDDEDTDEHQEARDERISDIDYEIEEIKDNPDGDPDEDSIEQEIENYLERIDDDAVGFLDDMGMDYENFLDKDRMKDDLVRDADYGHLNGYDGQYDEIKINETYYIVMRIN